MSIPDPIVLLDARARYVHPAFQMTRASTKTTFDAAGRLVTVPANAIGWDHDPATGESRGYRAEPQSTNSILYSNDLSQGYWTKTEVSVTPGSGGLWKISETANQGLHSIRSQALSFSLGSIVSCSFFAKAAERSALRAYILGSLYVDVDLVGGEIVGTGGPTEPIRWGVRKVGNDFCYVWFSGELVESTNYQVEVRMKNENGQTTYSGDGSSGLHIGRFQVEESEISTSYVPTDSSTATRAADSLVAASLNDVSWWHSDQGTVLIDVDLAPQNTTNVIWGHPDFNLNRLAAGWLRMGGFATDGHVSLLSPSQTLGRHLIAVSWNVLSGERVAVIDGTEVGSGGFVRDPSITSLGIGISSGGGVPANAHIRRAVYYPARLSNADLQSLTAIQE